MKRIATIALLIAALLMVAPVAFAGTVFSQGFETDTTGWFGSITRVASGTNGISSYAGSYHAIAIADGTNAEFTRFGGYSSSWPGGFTASAYIYLDTAWALGRGFDYSVAASNNTGGFLRDYVFHVTRDTSTGSLLVAGDNNSNFAPREDLDTLGNHYVVNNSGWYRFEQNFHDGGGYLAVDLKLYTAAGALLFTETRSNVLDTIPGIVGGNRYGWFTFVDVGNNGLAIDNTSLSTVPLPPSVLLLGSGLLGLVGLGWRRRKTNA